MNPLPPIVERPIEVGDVVVYDGFVFSVTEIKGDYARIVNNCGDNHFISTQDLSLL